MDVLAHLFPWRSSEAEKLTLFLLNLFQETWEWINILSHFAKTEMLYQKVTFKLSCTEDNKLLSHMAVPVAADVLAMPEARTSAAMVWT